MSNRAIRAAGGFVHDIEKISGLSNDPKHIRVLSDRSLYVLQNLAELDITFFNRYGTILEGGRYNPVSPDDPEASSVRETIDGVRWELMNDVNQGLSDIATAIGRLADRACCGSTSIALTCGSGGAGSGPDLPTPNIDDGTNPPVPGTWPNYPAYQSYKCNAAEFIVERIQSDIDKLQALNWGTISFYAALELVAVIAATIATPVVGDEILAVVGSIALLAGAMGPPLAELETAITTRSNDLICEMYNSTTVSNAKQFCRNIVAEQLASQTTGITLAVAQAVGWMFFSFSSLDILFDGDETQVIPTATFNCSSCESSALYIWRFNTATEGWSFMDASTLGASASGSHNSLLGSLKNTHNLPITANADSRIRWTSPTLNGEFIQPGGSVQVDFNAPSDAILTQAVARIFYQGAGSEEDSTTFTTAGTLTLTASTGGNIDYLEIEFGRTRSGTPGTEEWNWTEDMLEVRVFES